MATQPDMILQYAHYLGNHYQNNGYTNIAVTADVYVTLNGNGSRIFINDTTDLLKERESFSNKSWIQPFAQN